MPQEFPVFKNKYINSQIERKIDRQRDGQVFTLVWHKKLRSQNTFQN